MAYEVVMSYHLHMPSYFLGTFTEYPYMALLIFHSSCIGYVLSLARMGLFHGTFKLLLFSLDNILQFNSLKSHMSYTTFI